MREDADWILRATQRWLPREPTTKDRTLAAVNERANPSCEHCATIGAHEEAYVESSDVKGNLHRPYRLGYFCYRYCLDTGVLPSRKQLEDHHNGNRVKRPA
jgi:hypothetical protein